MYAAIAANKRNTILIILGFVGLLSGLSLWYGNVSGNGSSAIIIIGFVGLYTLFQYFMAGRIAAYISGGSPIEKSDNPNLWNVIENLCIAEGMPMPKVYVIDDPAPNAFAAGRDPEHAVVAVTTGLLDLMDENELTGVMAHELSHVKNYDIRVSTIVFGLVSAVALIADIALRVAFYGDSRRRSSAGPLVLIGLVAWLIAWLIGPIVSAAVSRQREYLADASAAEITRFPEGLASALNKLRDNGMPMRKINRSMSHLFLNDPVEPRKVARLWDTHPPLDARIERLLSKGATF